MKAGDLVMVPCRVKAIHLTEHYCNVDVETIEAMPPTQQATSLTLNSRQVERCGIRRLETRILPDRA